MFGGLTGSWAAAWITPALEPATVLSSGKGMQAPRVSRLRKAR